MTEYDNHLGRFTEEEKKREEEWRRQNEGMAHC